MTDRQAVAILLRLRREIESDIAVAGTVAVSRFSSRDIEAFRVAIDALKERISRG